MPLHLPPEDAGTRHCQVPFSVLYEDMGAHPGAFPTFPCGDSCSPYTQPQPHPGQEQHRGGDCRTQFPNNTFLPGSRLAAMALDTCPSWVLGRATLLGMEVQCQAAHRPTQTGMPGGCPDTPLPNSRFSLKKAFASPPPVKSMSHPQVILKLWPQQSPLRPWEGDPEAPCPKAASPWRGSPTRLRGLL